MFYTQLYQVFKKMLISEKGTLEMPSMFDPVVLLIIC